MNKINWTLGAATLIGVGILLGYQAQQLIPGHLPVKAPTNFSNFSKEATEANTSTTDASVTAPAWMRTALAEPTAAGPGTSAAKDATRQAELQRLQRVRAAAQQLRAAGEQGKDPQQVILAMRELESANGGPMLGGMDLAAMRQNIELAMSMKDKAMNLQDLQKRAASGDKSVSKEQVAAAMEELRNTQSQLSASAGAVSRGAQSR